MKEAKLDPVEFKYEERPYTVWVVSVKSGDGRALHCFESPKDARDQLKVLRKSGIRAAGIWKATVDR